MLSKPPALVSLNPDDDHARYVGHLSDGRQFFLTNPFVPANQYPLGREFIALYLFDPTGKLEEARVVDLGTRADLQMDNFERQFAQVLGEVGEFEPRRIEIEPFHVERFGVTFGFVLRPPEKTADGWCVTVEPGNYMEFHEPWDSGEYYT